MDTYFPLLFLRLFRCSSVHVFSKHTNRGRIPKLPSLMKVVGRQVGIYENLEKKHCPKIQKNLAISELIH